MSFKIDIVPDIANIPQTQREPIIAACKGKGDLPNLSAGNPDLPMPEYVAQRLRDHLQSGYMPYTHYYGLPELRQALAQKLKDEWQITADPETELLISMGVQEGLYAAMRGVLHPGDEVLIPSPHYGNYFQNSVACGAKPVLVPLDEQDGFVPDLKRLEKAVSTKTRALVFCNPNNPLGVVWPREILEGLADLAIRRNLLVLVDEIYHDFTFYSEPLSIATLPGMAERTFTFGGFSKSYMMMGLRIGFVVGPAAAMAAIKKLHYCIALCPSSDGQAAALAALECPREQLDPLAVEFKERIEMLYAGIKTIPGVTCVPPQGGFYIFPNFSCFGKSSMDLAIDMIEKVGVITLAGTEFGALGEGYLRLAVCAPRDQLDLGLARIKAYARNYL